MKANLTAPILEPVLANGSKKHEESLLPEHLMPIPGDRWALWRSVELRGAGFPAVLVDKLAASQCAATVDRLMQAEEEAQKVVLNAVNLALEALPLQSQEQRKLLRRAKRAIQKGELPQPLDIEQVKEAIESFRHAKAQIDSEWANFREAFATKNAQISQTIQEIAQNERFREAVIWQNRRLLHRGIDSLLHRLPQTHSRNAKQRSNEQLVAMYLQRYCVKNDTIGFFGPSGWANLVSKRDSLLVEPGASLIASRSVGFESWCIESLAEALSQNKALGPWLAPRRLPYIRLEGMTLHVPMQSPAQLPAVYAAILQACNGEQIAKNIAVEMLRSFAGELKSEEEVYQILEHFQSMGAILWQMEIPVEPNAEQILRRQLERIEDEHLRQEALNTLGEIESARSAIAIAAGNPEKLDRAIGDLEETFTRLTGVASTRADGEMYASRTLVYEDCRRDIKLELGAEPIESLGAPLSLLLTSARWLTFQTAVTYRQTFTELYRELVRQTGSSMVDALIFWHQAEPLLMDEKSRPFNNLLSMFQERWARVLSLPSGERRVTYTSEELRSRVLAEFNAPHAGWKNARYHSPDVLLDAPSLEEIEQGNYQFVLGELHLALNPLLGASCYLQHPCPEQLLEYYQRDLPEPFLLAAPPKQWSGLTTRTAFIHILPKDYCLVIFADAFGCPRSQVVEIGELVVEDTNKGLIVRTRDGRLQFDIIEAFEAVLSMLVLDSFKNFGGDRHLPRITIDRLVIQRESWSFLPAEIPFASEKNEAKRFALARRWAQSHDMPRYIFVKAPIETKPFYVDFDSPLYIDILAKTIRRSLEASLTESPIKLSEMLPTGDGLWLPDAENQRYSSELRMVALDLSGK